MPTITVKLTVKECLGQLQPHGNYAYIGTISPYCSFDSNDDDIFKYKKEVFWRREVEKECKFSSLNFQYVYDNENRNNNDTQTYSPEIKICYFESKEKFEPGKELICSKQFEDSSITQPSPNNDSCIQIKNAIESGNNEDIKNQIKSYLDEVNNLDDAKRMMQSCLAMEKVKVNPLLKPVIADPFFCFFMEKSEYDKAISILDSIKTYKPSSDFKKLIFYMLKSDKTGVLLSSSCRYYKNLFSYIQNYDDYAEKFCRQLAFLCVSKNSIKTAETIIKNKFPESKSLQHLGDIQSNNVSVGTFAYFAAALADFDTELSFDKRFELFSTKMPYCLKPKDDEFQYFQKIFNENKRENSTEMYRIYGELSQKYVDYKSVFESLKKACENQSIQQARRNLRDRFNNIN